MRYLIIGAGPAGLIAAETLCENDDRAEIVILSKEKAKPYSRVLLPYLLTGDVTEIYLEVPKRVEVLTGREVVGIDPQRREVILSTGEALTFDELLIASGASPGKPEVEGGDLPFVFTVRELSDIRRMREKVREDGRAIIGGGGLVSMRIGEALYRLGMKVTFVISSNRVLSRILDLPASALVARELAENGLEVITGEEIKRIEEGRVHLRSGEVRECDLVVFGKGVRPNVDFLKGSGIKTNGGIIVDGHQETNIEGIYAAGDVAETMDIVYDDRRVNALWPTAVEQGRIAALNMASNPAIYEGSIARNTLEVFSLPIFTAGMGREEGPQVLRERGKDFYHKIVLDDGILKGAIFVGEVKNEGFYLFLMKNRINVSPFTTTLLRNTLGYPRYFYSVALRGF